MCREGASRLKSKPGPSGHNMQCLMSHLGARHHVTVLSASTCACRPRVVECLLTLRRIYEVERNDGKRSPRRPFALSPRSGTPNVSGHPPLRLAQRHSSPFLTTPDVNYQAVQQVQSREFTALQFNDAVLYQLP